MADALDTGTNPTPGFSLVRMLPTLVLDVAVPIIVFTVLTRLGVSTLWALIPGGLAPALNNLRVWLKSGRLEPLGIIVIGFLLIGTLASIISGSVFFVLIKESFLTGTFGVICLGSLLASRPLMFYINRQFAAGDDPVLLEWWNGLWRYDDFRAGIRFVTAVWGFAYLIEALLRVALALVLPPARVVVLSPVMAFGVLIALIVWNQRYMLALRERRLRKQQQSQPA
jgi:hypothetical protein